MKLLTFAVPCYNSAAYMKKCIDSLLYGGEDVEIIIVNDGSSDDTAKIGEEYVKRYPTICRLINKENGGHGSAVNKGIEEATGLFFKVVDSDDWVKESAYKEILDVLKQYAGGSKVLDMLISNFVYDKVGAGVFGKHVMNFHHAFPANRIISWDDMGHMKQTQYILMHNIIYRHDVLIKSGLRMPLHTFYVDNLFCFQPLPYCEKLYYMDVNFYHYLIGREDQSVNEKVMISRIDQQIRVNKMMIDVFTTQNWSGLDKNVRKYMMNYLNKIMSVTSILLLVGGTEEDYAKKRDIWGYLKRKNEKLYLRLRMSFLGMWMNLPVPIAQKTTVKGYKVLRKFIHFN